MCTRTNAEIREIVNTYRTSKFTVLFNTAGFLLVSRGDLTECDNNNFHIVTGDIVILRSVNHTHQYIVCMISYKIEYIQSAYITPTASKYPMYVGVI